MIAALERLRIWPTDLLILWMSIAPTLANILVVRKFEKQMIAHLGLQPKLVNGKRQTTASGFIAANTADGSGDITL